MRYSTYHRPLVSRLFTKADLSLLIGLAVSVAIASFANFGIACNEIRSDVVRLHILANSDSEFDQQLKLKVRDRILSEMGSAFQSAQSQQEARQIAENSLDSIEKIARDELLKNGVDEPVTASVCNMYFTTREYDTFSLPAGEYEAVRVIIGEGKGQNWWCVMYPPMCVPSAAAEEMDSKEAQEIEELNNEPLFKPKLAILEWFTKPEEEK